MSVTDRVRELVVPLLTKEGLELFDVEFGGGRLAVLVDRPGGIDMGALTWATHQINAVLDAADPIPGRYLLEVSSPGLERVLRTPEHFGRFIGSSVSVKTKPGVSGERRLKGTLTGSDDDGFTVDERRFAYDDVERCHTVFEWGPAPRPGRPAAGKGKGKASRKDQTTMGVAPKGPSTAAAHDGKPRPDPALEGPFSSIDHLASADRSASAGRGPSADQGASVDQLVPAECAASADRDPDSDTKATAS